MAFAPTDALLDEVLDFLASSPSPEQIIAYQPFEPLKHRSHRTSSNAQVSRCEPQPRSE
jgi:hypothetical protein